MTFQFYPFSLVFLSLPLCFFLVFAGLSLFLARLQHDPDEHQDGDGESRDLDNSDGENVATAAYRPLQNPSLFYLSLSLSGLLSNFAYIFPMKHQICHDGEGGRLTQPSSRQSSAAIIVGQPN